MMNELIVRSIKSEDINLVCKSWKDSLAMTHENKWIPKAMYYAHYNALIDGLLKNNNCYIAANPEDDNHILGWACGNKDLLHYVFVKSAYRHLGIAKMLVDKLCGLQKIRATFWTDDAANIAVKHIGAITYYPNERGKK